MAISLICMLKKKFKKFLSILETSISVALLFSSFLLNNFIIFG